MPGEEDSGFSARTWESGGLPSFSPLFFLWVFLAPVFWLGIFPQLQSPRRGSIGQRFGMSFSGVSFIVCVFSSFRLPCCFGMGGESPGVLGKKIGKRD